MRYFSFVFRVVDVNTSILFIHMYKAFEHVTWVTLKVSEKQTMLNNDIVDLFIGIYTFSTTLDL